MFLQHMLGVLHHPKEEWKLIREEHYSAFKCYSSHMIYLAAIPPLSAFIGTTQVGWSITGSEMTQLTVASALPIAIAFYIWLGIFSVMILALFWAFAADLYNIKAGQKITQGMKLENDTYRPRNRPRGCHDAVGCTGHVVAARCRH